MSDFNYEDRIQYWSDDLLKENEEIDPIYVKLTNRMYTEPLTPEELHQLRSYLIAIKSIGTLLERDVEYQNSLRFEKKTFLQKLFRK
jgi:hypothetical protein